MSPSISTTRLSVIAKEDARLTETLLLPSPAFGLVTMMPTGGLSDSDSMSAVLIWPMASPTIDLGCSKEASGTD